MTNYPAYFTPRLQLPGALRKGWRTLRNVLVDFAVILLLACFGLAIKVVMAANASASISDLLLSGMRFLGEMGVRNFYL